MEFLKIQAEIAVVTQVAINAADVTLLAATVGRKGFTIHNDGDEVLHVKYGGAATVTNFTIALEPDERWVDPWGFDGAIHGIWAQAGAGNANMMEMT